MSQNTAGIKSCLSISFVYSLYQNLVGSRKSQRRLFDELNLKPGTRVLDLGCGTGDLIDCMPKGIEYLGCDLSEAYIKTAQKKYGHRGTFVQMRLGGNNEISMDGDDKLFDLVTLTGVLHHLEDEECVNLLSYAKKVLKDSGMLLCLDPVYTPKPNPIAKLILDHDRGRNIRTEDGYRLLINNIFEDVKYDVRTDFLRVPYTTLVMIANK